ncbi:MAG: hypothetical protein CVV41_06675 [Candidatus Riflebacteria bacterium HGW-Riflebacteria-1]|jgi:hypothetical protein|nr:MAG: hypothetical protein CVV41_06675 [Candidatus Riflebacteria bacterium HGW-Riflebacteria-1]
MKLTNKTTTRYFWREAGNRLFIEIDGKPIELKYSLAQSFAYQDFIKEDKELAKAEAETNKAERDIADMLIARVGKSVDHAVRVVEIAMNPKSEIQFTREQVLELFGEQLDLLQIISRTWVEKKVFNPALDSILDPHLAP